MAINETARAWNALRTVKSWRVPSSRRGAPAYEVRLYDDGQLSCPCKGWINALVHHPYRSCRHTNHVIGVEGYKWEIKNDSQHVVNFKK